MDLAIHEEFEFVEAIDFDDCEVWRYRNAALNFSSILYMFDGKISVQSRGEATPWHGSYTRERSRMILKFHDRGDERKMKTSVMFRTMIDRFVGYGSAGRHITMTLMDTMRYDRATNRWM